MKKRSQIIWLKQENNTTHISLLSIITSLVIWILLMVGLWLANLWMVSDVFPALVLEKRDCLSFIIWIMFVLSMEEALYYICKNESIRVWWRRSITVLVLGFGILGLCFYGFKRIDKLLGGMQAIADVYLQTFNSYYKTSYCIAAGDEALISGALLLVCMLLVCISWVLARKTEKKLILFVPTMLFLGLELSIGYGPKWNSIMLFLTASVFIAMESFQARGLWGSEILKKGILLFVLCICLVCTSVLGERITNPVLKKAPGYKAFQKQVEQTVSNLSLVTLFENKNTISNRTPEYIDKKLSKVILKGSLRPWCDLYVRTGYGMHYKNGSWTNDEKGFEQAYQDAGYDAREVLEKVKNSLEQNEWNPNRDYEISLEYFDTIEKWKWQRSFEQGQLSMQFGQGYELFNTICQFGDKENRELWSWYWKYLQNSIQEQYEGEEIVSRILEQSELYNGAFGYIEGGGASNIYDILAEEIEQLMAGEGDEEYYGNFLLDYCATMILDLLHGRCSYQLYLNEIPKGRDPIEYFLNESHQGYCVHFASAATLMLQRLGIPARYCTGYIVKSSAFQHVSRGVYEAEVLDRNAHAWVEIYMPGYGWIPYEMTPGYGNEQAELPTEQTNMEQLKGQRNGSNQNDVNQNSTDQQQANQTEATEEEQTEEKQQTESESKKQETSGKTDSFTNCGTGRIGKWGLFSVAAVAAGICVLVVLGIAGYRHQKQKKLGELYWKKQNYRKYVRFINRRLYRKLRRKGLLRGTQVTDAAFAEALSKGKCGLSEEDVTRYMEIVKKAAFSGEALTREEAVFCCKVYADFF